jgi:alkyl sulfatase BDS1-like metallo-beta-lactamase superfamily hydrolase
MVRVLQRVPLLRNHDPEAERAMKPSLHPRGTRWDRKLLAALLVLTSCAHAPTDSPGLPTGGPTIDRDGPLAKENANPRLIKHSNFFVEKPAQGQDPQPSVYHLRNQHWPLAQYPAQLKYEAYSAVGYDLANSMLLLGPKTNANKDQEWVIVDTLGSSKSAANAIKAFRAKVYGSETGGPAKLPLRAIIYTHNHIDHTGGVNGYLSAADSPPCASEPPQNVGQDGYFNADTGSCVAVIGQEKITSAIVNTSTIVGSIIDPRSAYMYGNAVPMAHINSGIGPQEGATRLKGEAPQKDADTKLDGAWYYMPSRTFSNRLNVTAAGMNMQLIYTPSETDDELIAFLPDQYNGAGVKVTGKEDFSQGPGLLLSAEVIQGPSFPNLYSLRGTSFRDPSTWYKSVDILRSLNSWCMVPSHGPPLCERNNIELLLRNFRDAVQFANDQAIRYINKGYTLAELPQLIQLPDYLLEELKALRPIQNEGATPGSEWVDPQDYLTEFYGSVSQGVREIYVGKVGFYQADPVQLRPIPKQEAASRLVQLMGKPATVLEHSHKALEDALKLPKSSQERLNGLQWAAELATLVIQAGVTNPNYPTNIQKRDECLNSTSKDVLLARQLKATAFAYLAEVEINPNWRYWYAASSRELTCELIVSEIPGGLVSPTIITALPGNYWVESFGWRLKAEDTVPKDVRKSLAFFIRNELGTNGGSAGYMLTIRKAVAQFNATGNQENTMKQADIVLSMERSALNELIINGDGYDKLLSTLKSMVDSKQITVAKGTLGEAELFLGRFDPKPIGVPVLSGR